jgi:hypothetical protein
MRHKFFVMQPKVAKRGPISTESGEPFQAIEFQTNMRHKIFMAAFVVILATAMFGWFFVLTWGFTKLIGFF